MFGVQEKGFSGIIEVDSGRTILFVPKASITTRIFDNSMRKADVSKKYEVEAHYENMIETIVLSLNPVYC